METGGIEIPFLILLLLIPLIGAVVTAVMSKKPKRAKNVALLFSGITLAVTLMYGYLLSAASTVYSDSESYAWVDTEYLRISFDMGVDGMSILMILLTAALVFIVTIFSRYESDRPNTFFALILAMEVGLMGVYMAQDYFLFYIFWEVTLIPMYFLISGWGGPRRHYAAIKFFIYTHVASLIMLIGIFMMVFEASAGGTLDFTFAAVKEASIAGIFSPVMQTALFGLLFLGFAAKMPIVPFHTWLPDAHVEAPTAGSVLLAAVMLKMGSYGIIRICLDIFPDGAVSWQPALIVIALVSIVYGAYACIAQKDLKKMVAFSSISHMGMVLLGIALLTELGIQFAIFQMFAHGLITSVLFMVCGVAGHNAGTREIPLLGGLAGRMPLFAAFMMFGFLASLGLPGLVGFVAEFGIIFAFFEYLQTTPELLWIIVFALASLLLTAGYYTWAMQRTIFGKETTKIDIEKVHDVSRTEVLALTALCAMIAIFGLMPSLILEVIQTMPLPMGVF
ncbi:MAG: NADH-quinone oxidoreductase subunit M [Methanomassiliicoccaceae archaeon]|jgi:NADH-quinone oxidoreductase subunit M|nr:NADH-quinone oxidoreductase subunit M [Methanomassiliicoccaceae archaeon]